MQSSQESENHRMYSGLIKRTRRKAAKIDKNVCWTNEMVEQLIASVEKLPVLWDMHSSEYRDLAKRTAAWQRIERENFNNEVPFAQLKKKWQLLCQTLSKKVAQCKIESNQAAAKSNVVWKFWGPMEFMRKAKNYYESAMNPTMNPLETSSETDETAIRDSPLMMGTQHGAEEASDTDARRTCSTPIASELQKTSNRAGGTAMRRVRLQSPEVDHNISSKLLMEMMSAIRSSVESIHSVASSTSRKHHDKFDDFGDFISSSLRQMPADFSDRAMAELQYSLSVLNKEAASLRLRRARQSKRRPR